MIRWILLFALLFATTAPLEFAYASEKRKVIIDDDGFGLQHLLLLEAKDVEVLGITTLSGNVWQNRATAQALRGLEIAGRSEVPAVPGAKFPLLNSEERTVRWEALYGKLTWKGAWMKQWVEPTLQSTPPYHGPDDPVDLPWGNPSAKPSDEIAALFLIRMAKRYPGEITIVAGGPMTNLALAQRLDPDFAERIAELVYMGGSFNPHQVLEGRSAREFAREFANSPRREFNMRFDPEAASIVSRSPWRKLTVVPVDPSTATQLTPALAERMQKAARPELRDFIGGFEKGFPLWDEVAVAAWLDPRVVKRRERLFVDYDTGGGATYGDTLSWTKGYEPGLGEQAADVVLEIDAAAMEALMVQVLSR